jgi:hypothetical protein
MKQESSPPDTKAADWREIGAQALARSQLVRLVLGRRVIGRADLEQVVADYLLIHAGAEVVETNPAVTVAVKPLGDADRLRFKILASAQAFQVLAQATGIQRVLQHLAYEHVGAVVKVLSHQQVQHLPLVEREVVVAVAITAGDDALPSYARGQGDIAPAFRTDWQKGCALLKLAIDHIEELAQVVLDRGMVRPGDEVERVALASVCWKDEAFCREVLSPLYVACLLARISAALKAEVLVNAVG